ncbi:MAG TPA: hypothetical protein VJU81_07360 [Methylomirabilota bacterium]|nr:hypothetical protein [Methylomirabilota bacterium]
MSTFTPHTHDPRPARPGDLAGGVLDALLRSELNALLDRVAAGPGMDEALTGVDPETRARTEEAEARLAAIRLRLLAGYEEWRRALDACGDLWALCGLRAAVSGPPASTADRRAA